MSDEGLTVFNGRYELLRRIARGGMADVYLARDASLDRQVAVKVLFPEFANDPSFVERFRREAKAAANLNHPNIVGIYDWGQEQGTYYIVMEYVVGRSMADVMRSTGRLSPDRAAEIASDVAEALSSAHNAGLVHRDIKLGNIIVSDDGQVKVADFGIATALARRTGDNLTHIGSVMGTATYFSPEQAQGKALDGRSDLYSLGVVLYEMIVGKPPFTADTSTAVAVKHVQERPLAPSLLGVSIVESLEAIILKLLAKNPANRYPKAEDLRADLQRYLAGAHSIPTRTGQSPRVQTGQSPRVRTGQSPRVRTGERPAIGSQVAPAPVAGRPRTGPVATAPPPGGGPPTGPRAQVPAAPGSGPGPPPQYVPPAYYYEEVHRSDGWKRTVLMFLGLVVLVVALVFLGWTFYDSLGLGDNNEPAEPTIPDNALIEVPDVSGLSYGEADALLRSAGLEPEPSYQVNTGVPENTVFAQSPLAGQRIEEGATVALTVSQGETPRVPPVRGRNRVDATEILRGAGYEVIVIEGTSQAEAGIVVGQEPTLEHRAGAGRGGDHHRVHRTGADLRARRAGPDTDPGHPDPGRPGVPRRRAARAFGHGPGGRDHRDRSAPRVPGGCRPGDLHHRFGRSSAGGYPRCPGPAVRHREAGHRTGRARHRHRDVRAGRAGIVGRGPDTGPDAAPQPRSVG